MDYLARPAISDEKLASVTNTLARWLLSDEGAEVPKAVIDWSHEEWLAAEWVVYWQSVLPWLVMRIQADHVLVPADVEERLLLIEAESRVRTARMLNNAVELFGTMDLAGIAVVPLKGAALAPLYYPDPGLRPMGDLDILVPKKDVKRGVEILEQLGYRFFSRSAEDVVYLRGERKQMVWAADNVHPVEMHYTLREEYAGLGYNLAGHIWRSSHKRDYWNGTEALMPDHATLLHHVCAHTTSDWLIQRGRLMHLDDVRKICVKMTAYDWNCFRASIKPHGARFVYPALAITLKYAAVLIPSKVLSSLRAECPAGLLQWVNEAELANSSRTSAVDRSGLGLDIADWIAQSRWEKVKIWWRSLFPRRWNLSKRYPRLVATPAWPLCYLLLNMDRLFRLAQKRLV